MLPSKIKLSELATLRIGGEASTSAIRQTLGTFCHYPGNCLDLWGILVTMQEVTSEINKMKRKSHHHSSPCGG